jgi:hypothetical protein
MPRRKNRAVLVGFITVQERQDGWYFSGQYREWCGPYPHFTAFMEQLGNWLEAEIVREYRKMYKQPPR